MDNTPKINQEIDTVKNLKLDYLTLQEKLEELWEKEKQFLDSIGVESPSK